MKTNNKPDFSNPFRLLAQSLWRDLVSTVIGGTIGGAIGLGVTLFLLGHLNLGLVGLFALLGAVFVMVFRFLRSGAFF